MHGNTNTFGYQSPAILYRVKIYSIIVILCLPGIRISRVNKNESTRPGKVISWQ